MGKSPDAFRTIGEVAELLDIPAHVLRFWESRFTQIRPVKRAGGRRYYRPTDVALLGGIRRLLHDQGMTIRGVQKLLRDEGVRHVCALAEPDLAEDAATELHDAAAVALPVPPPEPEIRVIPWPGPRELPAVATPEAEALQPAAPLPPERKAPVADLTQLPLFAGSAAAETVPAATMPAEVAPVPAEASVAPRVLVARLLLCQPGEIAAVGLRPLLLRLQELRQRTAAAAGLRGKSGV